MIYFSSLDRAKFEKEEKFRKITKLISLENWAQCIFNAKKGFLIRFFMTNDVERKFVLIMKLD